MWNIDNREDSGKIPDLCKDNKGSHDVSWSPHQVTVGVHK